MERMEKALLQGVPTPGGGGINSNWFFLGTGASEKTLLAQVWPTFSYGIEAELACNPDSNKALCGLFEEKAVSV